MGLLLPFSLLLVLLISRVHEANAISTTQPPPVHMELLITFPVEVEEEGRCYCCAYLNAVNSSLAIRQSAEHFCQSYNESARFTAVASLVVSRDNCADRVEMALMQRLRSAESAIVLPVKVQSEQLHFYARSLMTVEQDVAAFCSYHRIDHMGCRDSLSDAVQRHLLDTMLARARRLVVEKDEDASRVYLWPVEHQDVFVRERMTVMEGLLESQRVMQVENESIADYVLYLVTGPLTVDGSPVGRVAPERLVCLDYSDLPELPTGLTSEDCLVLFKRSWVMKEAGLLVGYPSFTSEPNVYPLHYTTMAQYWAPQQIEYTHRDVSVVCTLRPTTSARKRVLGWVTDAVMAWGLRDAFMGQYSDTVRHAIDKGYQSLLGRSRIIVTANPEDWDGDMRTWEALASGALVMVDACYTPFPPGLGLRHGIHVVVYDNRDRDGFFDTLHYYLTHPEEAGVIARRGQRFALRYHRAGSRMDYIDAVARVGLAGHLWSNVSTWKLGPVSHHPRPDAESGRDWTGQEAEVGVGAEEEEEEEEEVDRHPPWAEVMGHCHHSSHHVSSSGL